MIFFRKKPRNYLQLEMAIFSLVDDLVMGVDGLKMEYAKGGTSDMAMVIMLEEKLKGASKTLERIKAELTK